MGFEKWLTSVQKLRSELNKEQQSVRTRLLSDPYYRLRSVAEIAEAASLGIKIDANRAGVDDWLRLPGISIHQARSLVSLSQSGVQFLCVEDLAAALSWSVERLKPLEPILKFCYYDPQSVHTPQQINPNTATVEMLTKIPVVDTFLARAIVQNRESAGRYKDLADLQLRLSLPGNLLGELMHYFRF